MATNTLQTRIKSKIDYLANWNNNTTFVPLLGEICIAIIPRNISGTSTDPSDGEAYIGHGITDNLGEKGVERNPRINPNSNDPNVNVGLTPYAIGIKVGDGNNNFAALPWIQAIAGDIYAWAKAENPPSADQISAQYGTNQSGSVQDAINSIQNSIGGIVSSGITADALSNALQQLQAQLNGGGAQTIFESNPLNNEDPPTPTYPAKILRTIVKNGLSISTTSSQITPQDLPDLPFSKITEIDYPLGHNYADSSAISPNPLATKSYVDSEIQNLGVMNFIGVVRESDLGLNNENQQITIEDGSTLSSIVIQEGNTTRTIANLIKGSVILYDNGGFNEENVYVPNIHKEFVWTGTEWKELGDESIYAIKGDIDLEDLSSTLQSTITSKLTDSDGAIANKINNIEAGAQVNRIEKVKVNGTELTITNKEVNVSVPTGALASLNEVTESYLDSTLATKINGKANTSDLHAIAFTGDAINLTQTLGDYLIFDCGTASSLIDNPS